MMNDMIAITDGLDVSSNDFAGGGISYENVHAVMELTGVAEIHVGSAAQEMVPCSYIPERLGIGAYTMPRVSACKVSALRSLVVPQESVPGPPATTAPQFWPQVQFDESVHDLTM